MVCKYGFLGGVVRGERENDLETAQAHCFHALEPLLACEYNARFNGIRLPSVEQVDLTLKVATELVERRESLSSLSTRDRHSREQAHVE